MKLKVKKLHKDAVLPKYAKPGDAGMDLTAIDDGKVRDNYIEYSTGLSVEVPYGYVLLIFARSSITTTTYSLANSVGVVDSGYRGELTVRFRQHSGTCQHPEYKKGDRMAQFVVLPYPTIEVEETDTLTATERGVGGFGSSGR